jgi:2-dehydropantoate 2-reductase
MSKSYTTPRDTIQAGGIGGYFGARLAHAGRDVTFMVRPRRAKELAEFGLSVESPLGDILIANPKTVFADDIDGRFELILLSCKAYDLAPAISDVSPAIGPDTVIVPLLNGMKHLDILEKGSG